MSAVLPLLWENTRYRSSVNNIRDLYPRTEFAENDFYQFLRQKHELMDARFDLYFRFLEGELDGIILRPINKRAVALDKLLMELSTRHGDCRVQVADMPFPKVEYSWSHDGIQICLVVLYAGSASSVVSLNYDLSAKSHALMVDRISPETNSPA